MRLFQNVMEQYPSDREDALWGIGWTYFTNGEYKQAADVFSTLYEDYNETKYLYWKARSIEAGGGNTLDIYHKIVEKGHDFYSIMSYLRAERYTDQSSPEKARKIFAIATPVKGIFSLTGKMTVWKLSLPLV